MPCASFQLLTSLPRVNAILTTEIYRLVWPAFQLYVNGHSLLCLASFTCRFVCDIHPHRMLLLLSILLAV